VTLRKNVTHMAIKRVFFEEYKPKKALIEFKNNYVKPINIITFQGPKLNED